MKICYHGTSRKNARSILKQGFRPETWFARNLQDAVGFGGSHVFEVAFDSARFNLEPDDWQFFTREWIKPDKIVSYTIYNIKRLMDNKELRGKVFAGNT